MALVALEDDNGARIELGGLRELQLRHPDKAPACAALSGGQDLGRFICRLEEGGSHRAWQHPPLLEIPPTPVPRWPLQVTQLLSSFLSDDTSAASLLERELLNGGAFAERSRNPQSERSPLSSRIKGPAPSASDV